MILDDIVAKKKIRIEEHKKKISLEDIKAKAEIITLKEKEDRNYIKNKFKKALKKDGLSVIGEYKKASPSKGVIVENFDLDKIIKYYEGLNIDAYSVLTEEDFFLGSDKNLIKVKSSSIRPIIRKDFIVDFYQIYEAKVLGASAVLLIVAELKDKLKEFYDECKKFNLDVLVEVHNEEELKIALDAGAEIIGINNRNLKNFVTSLEITKKIISLIPKDKVIVSESGMHSIEDLKNAKELGADAVLVGEMFMRNINNKDFISEYKNFKGEK